MTLGPTKAARDLAPGDVVMWQNVAREVSGVTRLANDDTDKALVVHFNGGRWCNTGERYRFELASRPKDSVVEKRLTGTLVSPLTQTENRVDELLLTVYTDGAVELATRPAGSPGSWGPPVELRPIPAASTAYNEGVWP